MNDVVGQQMMPTAQSPDYFGDLIALVSQAETPEDLDAIMSAARRVVSDAYEGRRKMRSLRQALMERAVIVSL